MLQRLQVSQKIYALVLALLLGAVPVLLLIISNRGYAADLNNRKLQVGTSRTLAVTSHKYSFDLGTGGMLGSIRFQYCSNSPLYTDSCTAPSGLDVRGASNPPGQTGVAGFIVDPSTTASSLLISRAPVNAAAAPVTFTFNNIINPSTANTTVFVRIATFASIDGSGPATDRGSVAFSTSGGVGVFTFVPPYLTSCTGITVAARCTVVNGDYLDLGELSSSVPKSGLSQYSAGTNDPQGYVTYISGNTMTSGNDIIPALSTPQASSAGTGQFGLNLRANTNPSAGLEPTGVGTAFPTASYNTPNLFTFHDGDSIVVSSLATDFNVFTLTYLVNVPKVQPPGQYNTTLTLTTVVQF